MRTNKILLLSIITAFAVSCKKDFLETQPTQFTTPDQLGAAAAQDPKLLSGNITGLYTTMFTPGVGGTTGHDDFGQKGVDIYLDMLQSDMVLGALNYGWYRGIANYTVPVDYTTNGVYIPFRYYYRQIFGANTIIDVLGGTNATPTSAANKYTMAQAKIMRAYAYFYLSQIYAKGYGAGTDKILPLYTSTSQLNLPKSTTKDVYDLMISDLNTAITLLNGYTRTTKDQVDINVAKGFLAYVLAARGTQADLTQVVSLTQDIMSAYPKTTPSYLVYNGSNISTSGFNNVSAPSWMWGVQLTLAQGINLISWWGQVDQFTYSYAWAGDPKWIDRGLYDAIRSDDIRKGQFSAPNATYKLQPINKFFDVNRVSGGQRIVTSGLIYMRSDEFYLLNAEAKARLGQTGPAQTALTNYLSDRITNTSYISGLSGQALVDEIYLQTRIELWGEGKSYLAMKRLQEPVVRGSNHLFFAGSTFASTDDKLTMVIPQAEVLNNPNLGK